MGLSSKPAFDLDQPDGPIPSELGNGAPGYPAGPGWDACTGWGSPNGQALLEALRPIYYTLDVAELVASVA